MGKPVRISRIESNLRAYWYAYRAFAAALVIGMLIGAGCAFTISMGGQAK